MICYGDRTFCNFSDCIKFGKCARTLTKRIIVGARQAKLPISQFLEKPDCFQSVDDCEDGCHL